MAISATLELRDDKGIGSAIAGSLINSYTVIDLDYTLKRAYDKSHRPCSVATMDFIKVTIRGAKEMFTPFHEWIQDTTKMKHGVIKIFDSSGVFSSTFQDVTGGEAPLDMGILSDLATEEVEDTMGLIMDQASDYDDTQGDIFDEMSKKDMIKYIDEKKLPIEVDKDDTEEIIRAKIRGCKKLENKSLSELEKESGVKKDEAYNKLSEEEKKKKCTQLILEKSVDGQMESTAKNDAIKAAEKAKKKTTQTLSSVAGAAMRSLQAARAITFEDAYCVSLREHFKVDSSDKGTVDSSYPWILEIGIKPGKVKVAGANFGGKTLLKEVEFKFFE